MRDIQRGIWAGHRENGSRTGLRSALRHDRLRAAAGKQRSASVPIRHSGGLAKLFVVPET